SSSEGKAFDGRPSSLMHQGPPRHLHGVPRAAMGGVTSALCKGECRTENAAPLKGLHMLREVVCSSSMRTCLDLRPSPIPTPITGGSDRKSPSTGTPAMQPG